MRIELTLLALSAAFCAVMWVPYILARINAWGLIETLGYPENPPPVPAWADRLQKAHANMVENLAPFAALVLVAHAADALGPLTALGAVLFFWARIVHVGAYALAIPYVRTLAFAVAWVGMVLIFVAILGK